MNRLFLYSLPLKRFTKYMSVGVLSFLTEYASFVILIGLLSSVGNDVIISQTLSFSLALVVNFLGNKKFTFSDKTGKFVKNTANQVTAYLLLASFNLLLTNIIIYVLTHSLAVNPLVAKLMVMALVVLWNFAIFNKFIFKNK